MSQIICILFSSKGITKCKEEAGGARWYKKNDTINCLYEELTLVILACYTLNDRPSKTSNCICATIKISMWIQVLMCDCSQKVIWTFHRHCQNRYKSNKYKLAVMLSFAHSCLHHQMYLFCSKPKIITFWTKSHPNLHYSNIFDWQKSSSRWFVVKSFVINKFLYFITRDANSTKRNTHETNNSDNFFPLLFLLCAAWLLVFKLTIDKSRP